MIYIVGIVLFTLIIFSFVIFIFLLQFWLVPEQQCKLVINDQPATTFTVNVGESLLCTLAEQKIFLPSACGGKGTCGMCTCIITSGAGPFLAIEDAMLTRLQQKQQLRLACQLKVIDTLHLTLSSSVLHAQHYQAKIKHSKFLAPFIKELTLELINHHPFPFLSGQYIQLDIPAYSASFLDIKLEKSFSHEWEQQGLLAKKVCCDEAVSRAYSLANAAAVTTEISLIIRLALPLQKLGQPGVGSSYLFLLEVGSLLEFTGPFGNFLIKNTQRECCYIAGGVGIAAIRSHLQELFLATDVNPPISLWQGARSQQDLVYANEFEAFAIQKNNFSYYPVISEPIVNDSWNGRIGLLNEHIYTEYVLLHPTPTEVDYYICGPLLMMTAVTKMLIDAGIPAANICSDPFN